MSTLLHPLSLSMLRDAADDVVSDVLMWAKYSAEITEHVDEIITEVLLEMADAVESETVTDRDDAEEIIGDFCDKVAEELEMSRGNGVADDMISGEIIYTSDIMDYYTENTDEVDEALSDAYGDLSDFGTLSDAISTGVAMALHNTAESEIFEVMQAFETWAKDEMINHIFA